MIYSYKYISSYNVVVLKKPDKTFGLVYLPIVFRSLSTIIIDQISTSALRKRVYDKYFCYKDGDNMCTYAEE
jgi:hypothetical protein